MMTANNTKMILEQFLVAQGICYTKMIARTVGFGDLTRARTDMVFVTIYGIFTNSDHANKIRNFAKIMVLL